MKKLPILLIVAAMLFGSCTSSEKAPSGEFGELLVVVENDVWTSAIGDSLRILLESPIFGLPQPENAFDIKQITPGQLSDESLYHRNILKVILDSEDGSSKLKVNEGTHAKSQIILSLIAPTEEKMSQLIEYNKRNILREFSIAERKRIMEMFKNRRNGKIVSILNEKFKINLAVPGGFSVREQKKDFLWVQQNMEDIQQVLLVHTYPINAEASLSREFVTKNREKMTSLFVPGTYEGSHMIIEPQLYPQYDEYTLNGRETAELRGLWRMSEGDQGSVAMGGPFVNITQLDSLRNRAVSVDVFVFAPRKAKRPLMIDMEAIQMSLEILK